MRFKIYCSRSIWCRHPSRDSGWKTTIYPQVPYHTCILIYLLGWRWRGGGEVGGCLYKRKFDIKTKKRSFRLSLLQNYFFPYSSPWWVIHYFEEIYLKKKCFVPEISRFLCFCGIYRFQNLWRYDKHDYIMKVKPMRISFES